MVERGLAAESSAKAPEKPQDRRKFSSCKGLKSAGSMSALAYVRDYFSASTTRCAFVTKAHGNSRAKPEVCKADPRQSRGGFAEASTTKVTFCRQRGDALATNPSSPRRAVTNLTFCRRLDPKLSGSRSRAPCISSSNVI